MIEGSLGLIVEGLVSVLLVATIFYCISVNRKLERLRDEQQGMHSFIRELSVATANADKAIQGLRTTVQDSGAELAGQIDKGRNMSRQLKNEIESASQTMNKLIVLTKSAQSAGIQSAGVQSAASRPAVSTSEAVVTGNGAAAPLPQAISELRNTMLGFDDVDDELSGTAPVQTNMNGGAS